MAIKRRTKDVGALAKKGCLELKLPCGNLAFYRCSKDGAIRCYDHSHMGYRGGVYRTCCSYDGTIYHESETPRHADAKCESRGCRSEDAVWCTTCVKYRCPQHENRLCSECMSSGTRPSMVCDYSRCGSVEGMRWCTWKERSLCKKHIHRRRKCCKRWSGQEDLWSESGAGTEEAPVWVNGAVMDAREKEPERVVTFPKEKEAS